MMLTWFLCFIYPFAHLPIMMKKRNELTRFPCSIYPWVDDNFPWKSLYPLCKNDVNSISLLHLPICPSTHYDEERKWVDSFLDASSHLYRRVCPSVRVSVCPYVRTSVTIHEKPPKSAQNSLKTSLLHTEPLRTHLFARPGLFFLAFLVVFCTRNLWNKENAEFVFFRRSDWNFRRRKKGKAIRGFSLTEGKLMLTLIPAL